MDNQALNDFNLNMLNIFNKLKLLNFKIIIHPLYYEIFKNLLSLIKLLLINHF